MTEVTEAESLIMGHMPEWPTERVSLDKCMGRVLAEDVQAERDMPAFDRVTMDGIAVEFVAIEQGIRDFEIAGVQAAGVAALAVDRSDQCIRVMTGAVRPEGTDTVIPIERIELADGHAIVEETATVQRAQFVHCRGSDRQQGSVALAAGLRIGPAEAAVLAANGKSMVQVAHLPNVAVISTGDELVDVDEPIEPWQIRSSNDRAIQTSLLKHGLGRPIRVRLRDDEEQILSRIEALHEQNDVLILSGGVSMGDFDFVPSALQRLGTELVFHRVNQKPGRPMWFGISKAGKPVFALPGNPVSTLVCLARYVIPAFERASGLTDQRLERVRLAAAAPGGPAHMTWFVPVVLDWTRDGMSLAHPRRINTSGDFSALAGTDGIVELTTSPSDREKGASAPFYRW